MNTEPMSHIIFPKHHVFSVPANNVVLVALATKAALQEHDALRSKKAATESAGDNTAVTDFNQP